jgi:hypothetical protein
VNRTSDDSDTNNTLQGAPTYAAVNSNVLRCHDAQTVSSWHTSASVLKFMQHDPATTNSISLQVVVTPQIVLADLYCGAYYRSKICSWQPPSTVQIIMMVLHDPASLKTLGRASSPLCSGCKQIQDVHLMYSSRLEEVKDSSKPLRLSIGMKEEKVDCSIPLCRPCAAAMLLQFEQRHPRLADSPGTLAAGTIGT